MSYGRRRRSFRGRSVARRVFSRSRRRGSYGRRGLKIGTRM